MYVTVTDDSQMYNALCGHSAVIPACIQNETFFDAYSGEPLGQIYIP